MKLTTIKRNNYLFEYSPFELIEDTTNPSITYKKYLEPPITYEGDVSSNAIGELVIYTEWMMMNNGLISRVQKKRNRLDNPKTDTIIPDLLLYPIGTKKGAIWRIIEGQPMLDLWGNKNVYRYRCRMIVPAQGSVTQDIPDEYLNSINETQN